SLVTLLGVLGLGCQSAPFTGSAGPAPGGVAAPARAAPSAAAPEAASGDTYIHWLVDRSMLHQAELTARRYSGQGQLWQHPYANPQPRAASALASVWFTAYPPSHITRPGESVLRSLGDPELWSLFKEIGIKGVHTGPMKRAGGIRGREYTPTIDGNFDRISTEIDPGFGSDEEYRSMVRRARDNGAVAIGDIVPGHSGKGADFRLAERGYGDYPGLYHMVEIQSKDWGVLPPVPAGKHAVNLKHAAARRQWLPRYRGRFQQRPGLVRGASAVGHVQPTHRRHGPKARWLHLPGAQPHPRRHQGHVPRWRRSLLRLRDPPRLPSRPRHRRCRILAPHARAPEDLPDRSGRPHPRAPEPRRAHPRAGALLDPPQGRHLHVPRQDDEGQRAARDHPSRDAQPPPRPVRALQPGGRQWRRMHHRHRGRRRPRDSRRRPPH